ncbi:FAD-binding oxidoreductase [Pelagibaculum spongiae]|uniref:FAD-binding oxidoreductase n=1 Tax=Pelagibaculum spongiae TaxID=2080658 RepID=A0A2V1GXD0_9GAMM|nr:FAD-binding oxidoreductase [Pelagibaculum spongiae]PVZ68924.1 FAD-binding oxidoreductase [Pelagibaculum spongiae]
MQDLSWGRLFDQQTQDFQELPWRFSKVPPDIDCWLPWGNGRSYGDLPLNPQGSLISTQQLNHLISFDPISGRLKCESGVTLEQIIQLVLPWGWFLPVTPGTAKVTLGGAIANDVHGKNHHHQGCFGNHILQFELVRSDRRLVCSPEKNSDFFSATIAGMGLTGLISWAEIQLMRVPGSWLSTETIRYQSLDDFLTINQQSKDWPYTVAWVDSMATGKQLGRGVYMRGRHIAHQADAANKKDKLDIPLNFPNFALNKFSVAAFNQLYYYGHPSKSEISHYRPFFYPLDAINRWNRIYGKRGFYQYQCVVPKQSPQAVVEILKTIAKSGQGSFLTVLKEFGDIASPGMLSFPMPGITYALDFANRGSETKKLFKRLDAIVAEAGGRLYPAKDAAMSAEFYQQSYPNWQQFEKFIDPKISSAFWQRVMGNK